LCVISRYGVCDKGWVDMEPGFLSRYGQKIFYFTLRPDKPWGLRSLLPNVYGKDFSREWKGLFVKLVTYVYLVPGLKYVQP